MSSNASRLPAPLATALVTMGARIRDRRKALEAYAVATAEVSGVSRVTLHRIERGEPSVSMGAYLSVAAALGLEFNVFLPTECRDPKPLGYTVIE
jgi:transcriptional regulator with XRE-family HTH domain